MSKRMNKLIFQIMLVIIISLTIGSVVSLGLIPVGIEALFYTHFNIISLIFVFVVMVYLIRR